MNPVIPSSVKSMAIDPTAVIHPGVVFSGDAEVGPFCIIGQPCRDEIPRKTIIGAGVVIRSHSVIYAGNQIGNHFQTGHHVVVREDNVIGDDVSVGSLSCVEHHVTIGSGVRIHSQVFIPEYSVLEEESWIGPQVLITNARYPRSRNVKNSLKGATIRKRAKIGGGCTLLPGVDIGENSLVGAGSVVTKNIPAGEVHAGQPARFFKKISELEEYTP
jgi:acetyltransferase-like isoleucine patch superfamily enzyme